MQLYDMNAKGKTMSFFDSLTTIWKAHGAGAVESPAKGKVDWDAINAAAVDTNGSKALVANAIGEAIESGARLKL